MDLEVVTPDAKSGAEPNEAGAHRVTFSQDCWATATNAPKGGNVGLDLEIVSLAMERSKGSAVALSFDSEQGGEATDDYGYIPVLQNLIGGHLQFLLSAEGKVIRAAGINEWLARGLGDAPARSKALKVAAGSPAGNNSAPSSARPTVAKVAAPLQKGRGNVAGTLRNFFNQDHFREMLEFSLLPSGPVRVEEEWKTQADTFVNGRGRFRFDVAAKFAGWQQHGPTNCARIDAHGNPPGITNAPPKPDQFSGTLWINQGLGFPVGTILNTQIPLPDDTVTRKQGTNTIVIKSPPKFVHQSLAITLIEVNPIESARSDPPSE